MLSILVLVSGAGTLSLKWSDCGDADTHAKVTGLTPAALTLGQETDIVGVGALDEDVQDGTYTMSIHASIISKTFTGKLGEKSTFELPLGLGSLSWDGLSLPLAKGPAVKVGVSAKLSASIPEKFAAATIKIEATEANGHKLLCLQVNTAPEAEVASADVAVAALAEAEEESTALVVADEAEVGAGTLSLKWSDCGDADTHAKVTGLTPAALTLGQETDIVGVGALDEDVQDGTYTMSIHASIISKTFTGKLGEKSTFELPLGLGSLSWDGLSLPLAKGPAVKVGVSAKLSASIPEKFAAATIKIEATEANGHKLLCLQVNTAPQTVVLV